MQWYREATDSRFGSFWDLISCVVVLLKGIDGFGVKGYPFSFNTFGTLQSNIRNMIFFEIILSYYSGHVINVVSS